MTADHPHMQTSPSLPAPPTDRALAEAILRHLADRREAVRLANRIVAARPRD